MLELKSNFIEHGLLLNFSLPEKFEMSTFPTLITWRLWATGLTHMECAKVWSTPTGADKKAQSWKVFRHHFLRILQPNSLLDSVLLIPVNERDSMYIKGLRRSLKIQSGSTTDSSKWVGEPDYSMFRRHFSKFDRIQNVFDKNTRPGWDICINNPLS